MTTRLQKKDVGDAAAAVAHADQNESKVNDDAAQQLKPIVDQDKENRRAKAKALEARLLRVKK